MTPREAGRIATQFLIDCALASQAEGHDGAECIKSDWVRHGPRIEFVNDRTIFVRIGDHIVRFRPTVFQAIQSDGREGSSP